MLHVYELDLTIRILEILINRCHQIYIPLD